MIFTFLSLTTLQVQSPNSLLELEDEAHENLEDPHPSDNVHVHWSLDFKCISEKEEYVKEIKGEKLKMRLE